jgi:cell division protein FtsN
MEYVGIFLFGIVVTAIVIAACFLIVFGIITEKQEREKLEAQQAADLTPDREFEAS